MRGVLQQPSPGLAERGRLRWWKSPLSHRPHHPDSRRRGPAAGREAAGRANFKPPACSSLPAPRNRSRTIPGKALFQMAGPTSPPARRAQPPAGSPFRRAGFPGQDFGRPLPPPWPRRQPVHTEWCGRGERVGGGAIPCSSLGRRVAQTCPPGSGSPLECAPGARPSSLHSSRCGPAPPPRMGGRGGGTIGLGSGTCPCKSPVFKAMT